MTNLSSATRTGEFVRQPAGFVAFYPANLPFVPSVRYDDELQYILSKADQAIGRLDSAAEFIPNPDIFVGMYIQKEAVLTSQLEGVTQASLSEFLEQEAVSEGKTSSSERAEVRNYVRASNYAIDRLNSLPLGLKLIQETHEQLLLGVRGSDRSPGRFRTEQNWIGRPGSSVFSAAFVPPPPDVMVDALNDLEQYIHDEWFTPDLVKAGLLHYQFETIHPFRDGNGRIGRLIVVLYLCQREILKRPLLYLSEFINEHKREYYDRLQAARDTGDIEGWLKFFLTAVWRVSDAAGSTAQQILALREGDRKVIGEAQPRSGNGLRLLDYLFESPYVTVNSVAKKLGVTFPTANNLVRIFEHQGILEERVTGYQPRLFRYHRYIQLMEQASSVSQDLVE